MTSVHTRTVTKSWFEVVMPAPGWRADIYLALTWAEQEYERIHGRKDVQAIIDHFDGHEFAGYIQVQWDPGFEDPIPTRYYIRDRRVVEVRPTLVWPDEATPTTNPQELT